MHTAVSFMNSHTQPPWWLIYLQHLWLCETLSGEVRLQQPVAAKMSGRSPQRSVKSRTLRSLPGTLHQTRIFCSLLSPLWIAPSVLQLWPLFSRAREGPCSLEYPHQQCRSVLTRNQENYGPLSSYIFCGLCLLLMDFYCNYLYMAYFLLFPNYYS